MIYINIILALLVFAVMIAVFMSKGEKSSSGSVTDSFELPYSEIKVTYDGNEETAEYLQNSFDKTNANIEKLHKEYAALGEEQIRHYEQEYIKLQKDSLSRLAEKEVIYFFEEFEK